MYKGFLLFFGLLCLGCKNRPERAVLYGKISNPTDSLVVLYSNEKAIDSVKLNSDDSFHFVLNSVNDGLFYFKTGNFFQYVYLEKGDSLFFTSNTFNFHKSVMWSGEGSQVNNFISSIRQKTQNQENIYDAFFSLSPDLFTQKVDSIYKQYVVSYEKFLTENKEISPKAKKIAWASFFFDAHKPYERYLFEHNHTSKEERLSLPENFYSFRRKIDVNDEKFSLYTPYHQYLTHYINNISYVKNLKKKNLADNKKMLHFQLNRLEVIDSIFSNKTIKDNMVRTAVFSYLLHPHGCSYNSTYIEKLQPYIEHNSHKKEIENLYQSVLKFGVGKEAPSLQLIDIKEDKTNLSTVIKPNQINIFYFWSSHNPYQLLHQYMRYLERRFPNYNFAGIDTSHDFRKWSYNTSDTQIIQTNQYHIYGYRSKIDKNFVTYNLNRAVIIDRYGKLNHIFVDINSQLENVLNRLENSKE